MKGKEIMKTKKRNLFALAALAVVMLAGVAGGGYAYWAGSVGAPTAIDKNDTVTIGTGQSVTTTLSVGNAVGTGVLVPPTRSVAGQVEYVILTHAVEWKESTTTLAAGHPGTLSAVVKAGTTKIGTDTTHAALVNISFQVGGTAPAADTLGASVPAIALDGLAVTVYIKVTLTEPDSQATYTAVAGKTISFDVTFSVLPS